MKISFIVKLYQFMIGQHFPNTSFRNLHLKICIQGEIKGCQRMSTLFLHILTLGIHSDIPEMTFAKMTLANLNLAVLSV